MLVRFLWPKANTCAALAGALLSVAAMPALALAGEPGAAANTSGIPCIAARPALATTGRLARTSELLRNGEAIKILAIGSSSTAGTGTSSPAAAYPAQLAAEIKRRLPSVDVKVIASGVAGETATQTLARLALEVEREKPDLVIWQVGTNDALTGVAAADFRNLVESGVASATRLGAELILLDQQFYPTIRKRDRYERFVAIVKDVGLEKRACVFDRYAMMKTWSERSGETFKAMLASDGFHMSDRGHACMAKALADEIVGAALHSTDAAVLAF